MAQETPAQAPGDGGPFDIPAEILEAVEKWRKAADDNAVQVAVNGEFRPIGDLNWVLKKSCGCARAIMYAAAMDRTFYDVESAWHEIYSSDPHPHKRVRDREIKRMRAEGYAVVLMDRHEAVDLYVKGCVIHRRENHALTGEEES